MARPRDLPPRFNSTHPALRYRPPAWMRLARVLIVGASALALLVVAYVGFWFYGALATRSAVESWASAMRADGHEAAWDRLELSGFPLWTAVRLDNPRLAAPAAVEPWSWQGSRVTIRRRPWEFSRFIFDATGDHWGTLGLLGNALALNGSARRLVVAVGLDKNGQPWQAALDGADLTLADGKGKGSFAAAGLDIKWQRGQEKKNDRPILFDLLVEGRDLRLPEAAALPLGPSVAAVAIEGSWVGDLPKTPLKDALGKWRDDGGTVEVVRFAVRYGALDMTANGTMALDAALQPIGAFTAKAAGFFEVIEALRAKGLVRSRDSAMAKVVLGMLSKKGENGGSSTVSLPLSIQDRTLYAGPVELARLHAIEWDGPRRPPVDADLHPPPPAAAPRVPVVPQVLPPPGKG